MIHEIVIKPENLYGKYFLSTEAPGDELPPERKSNTKVIDVKPNNRRRKDFTDRALDPDNESEDEELPPDDLMDTTGDEDTPPDDLADGEAPQDGETPPDDLGSDDTPDTGDDTDSTTGEELPPDGSENGESSPEGDSPPDETGDDTEINTDETDDSPDTGDNTDFTADTGEGDTPPDQSAGDSNTGDDGNQKKGPGLEYDSTRKYMLFINYKSLINAISNYITKLENNISDDMNSNKIIRTAVSKLREIKELCYDYITMKFEGTTYIQSLLFYQNAVIMVQSVFDMLIKMKKYLKTQKEE